MTRSDLIARLAGRFPQLTAEDARLSVEAILHAMAARLAGNGRVEIRGFGSFSVHRRPPRLGRNPKTGERVPVPEKCVPHFKPGVELRERVNLTEHQVTLKKAGMPYVLSEPVTLTRRESLRLLEQMENPSPRNEKFKTAMTDYGETQIR